VPPFPWPEARDIVEQQLGMSLQQAFRSFDENELASASIAQVYCAELHDGQEVVVKIVRPGIERKIRQDIEVLMLLARMADRYWDEAKRIKPIQIVSYAVTSRDHPTSTYPWYTGITVVRKSW